ncbi:type II toxin-antitoxin system prevent-host-death family antitoxin [Endozoicomonas sp. GU-1]|uniref:type II toxin-antitoxin system Phd/YefM family antitoxin n=1 Tax=Endozoicomonas sp. GU-1 TaxID=3009078 RepID=UPI0022B538E1|nr:type II toxin-antitoxin system prevent-host-death family antitoxin [Endozoicomonas sp. GU-1]WBA82177.1 type II toxin-antitoxin system prevent-host-death family antitoxin [Endozoicomonas sp. GU-1]WBA85117.1 type II toxin-antitoxin system prevent-host-death family antitoxin [Endozoicomonas sp. GU-1]
MEQVNISELRANLLDYLKKAQQGQPFIVTSNGQTLATICALDALKKYSRKNLKEVGENAIANDIIDPLDKPWENRQ